MKKKKSSETTTALVYVGPSIRGKISRFTSFLGDSIPGVMNDVIEACPFFKSLFVPVDSLGEINRQLKDPQTPIYAIYSKAQEFLTKGGN